MTDKRKVFISYTWRDGAAVARWLFARFNATPGWSAWMDDNLHADSVFAHALSSSLPMPSATKRRASCSRNCSMPPIRM
jgi:hypothetical protein